MLARPRLSSAAEGAETVVGPAALDEAAVAAVGVWATVAPATTGRTAGSLATGAVTVGPATAGAVTGDATPLNSGEDAEGIGDSDGADRVERPDCDSGCVGAAAPVVAWPAASSG